jgi:hypothetical protein
MKIATQAARRRQNAATPPSKPRIDFDLIARAALPHALTLCARWLPGGKLLGHEWTCGSLAGEAGGSCKVNVNTGRWADFEAGSGGGDLVSLAAAIHHIPQGEAARKIADMLGLDLGGRHV